MKKSALLATFFAIFLITTNARAAVPASSDFSLPDNSTAPPKSKIDQLRLAQMKLFAAMTLNDYEKLKGKKLNFMERLTFKISQHRMKKMVRLYEYGEGPTTLQKIGALLKGLLSGPIAVILGYIFLKDDDRELIKWIWFGFAGFAIIIAIILISL